MNPVFQALVPAMQVYSGSGWDSDAGDSWGDGGGYGGDASWS